MELKFRTLRAEEIECRVNEIGDGFFTLLLYKDARCDMNLLDEVVGALNWKREHCRENANCIVSIWDPDKSCWVSKEDTGTESNTEKEKGLASDSFKRACTCWGIGRELYSAPYIKVSGEVTKKNTKGKFVPIYYNITVKNIAYDSNRNISELVIYGDGKEIFSYPKKKKQEQNQEGSISRAINNAPKQTTITRTEVKTLQEQAKDLIRARSSELGIGWSQFLAILTNEYKVDHPDKLTDEQAEIFIKQIKEISNNE